MPKADSLKSVLTDHRIYVRVCYLVARDALPRFAGQTIHMNVVLPEEIGKFLGSQAEASLPFCNRNRPFGDEFPISNVNLKNEKTNC